MVGYEWRVWVREAPGGGGGGGGAARSDETPPPSRVDEYFPAFVGGTVGVKTRGSEAGVEVKVRTGVDGAPPTATGAERWIKEWLEGGCGARVDVARAAAAAGGAPPPPWRPAVVVRARKERAKHAAGGERVRVGLAAAWEAGVEGVPLEHEEVWRSVSVESSRADRVAAVLRAGIGEEGGVPADVADWLWEGSELEAGRGACWHEGAELLGYPAMVDGFARRALAAAGIELPDETGDAADAATVAAPAVPDDGEECAEAAAKQSVRRSLPARRQQK